MQVMPNPKSAMRDLTLHPASVVVVLNDIGERTISVSTKNDSPALPCTVTKARVRLLVMIIVPDLWLAMAEYGCLAYPTIGTWSVKS